MKTRLIFLWLLASAFAVSVKGKPHDKHEALSSHIAKQKDIVPDEVNEGEVLPTFMTFESSSQEQEDGDISSEDNANVNVGPSNEGGLFEVSDSGERSTPVLLRDKALVELLQGESEEEEVDEEEEEEEGKIESEETQSEEEEEEEGEEEVGDLEKEEEDEETDSNTKPEIPEDLDSDSDNTEALELEEGKPLAEDAHKDDEIPTATDDYESQPDIQDAEFTESQEVLGQYKYDSQEKGTNKKDADTDTELQETKNSVDLDGTHLSVEGGEEKEEKNINKSASHTRGKARKQRKNQRVRKHPLQRDEAPPGEGVPDHQGDEGVKEHYRTTDSAVYKPKRRRAGKWAPLVGMSPVQIRATVVLYPSTRPSLAASLYRPQASAADPCENFSCKHGKTCKLNKEKKPVCVCHEPSACPQSVTDYDHVCGTDNVTYTPCEFFATKCNLEGTKRGHRLHLDYTGVCKFIAPCMTGELVQFPLRMRDWLKNVLLHLYEHDSMSPGFLTPKQRIRVRKIHESERRLHAGDHPIELLAQDFEKNYNMYIYPVHWQFAQMDQHPSDRFLSHSELATLRVPLVPMEHCTSRFFQECDADKDKYVSFREWNHCFGIKDEDMDVNLLF
ncbi:unnamed protein product [Oncorhynchus mykiss]|uniref:Kazal-like domain-containing protein n=1 Tax=Oncorhynchus mykiss TaxID=8022 RepID=A0A060XHN0_ONCMY|nr:unnamed protein product [Oncorhynchus mykiss]